MPRLSANNTVPNAVNRLRLIPALSPCCNTNLSLYIDKSTSHDVYVYDDNVLKYSDWDSNSGAVTLSKCFNGHNPNGIELCLLPLDNRMITDPTVIKGGITDCALLTDTEFTFVEFKTNATSRKNIGKNSNKAMKQLWHTYDSIVKPRCLANGVDLDNKVIVEFHIVFDTSMMVTGAMASFQNRMTLFCNQHHKSLFFENYKEYL